MSDAIKLSELLDDIAQIMEDSTWVIDIDRGHAFRAIAPVLVEAVQNHGNLYQTHVPENCIGCKVHRALAEAGVTCE